MNLFQVLLPILMGVYVLQIFVIKSYVQWRKTGVNPFVFGQTDTAHDYIGWVYKVLMVGTWCAIIIFSFFSKYYQYLLPVQYLEIAHLKWLGFLIMTLSFIWIVIAQYHMSASWRIGINYDEKTTLVANGVFSVSRNPVFLGILLTYLGAFLVIPNALTFALLMVAFFVIQIQVRMEEEYLQGVHGEQYQIYMNEVRRWL